MSDKIVCIKKYLNRHEADVAKSVLDSNQIDCYVASDDSGSMRPSLSFVSPFRLMVKGRMPHNYWKCWARIVDWNEYLRY
jgi:hypothetical protein